MPKLSIEQVFGNTPLDGSLPVSASFSPDGSKLVYLCQAEDNRERLDLWSYDTDSKSATELVNVSTMGNIFEQTDRKRTSAEKAEAERKRMFSSGITSYMWHPLSKSLLFPVEGALYSFDFEANASRRVTAANTRQTDFAISPVGDLVSYVRGGDLYLCSLANGIETRLTHSATDTCTNGLASFIAQEEMNLFEGHWWSPDGTRIAYTEIENNNVPESQRYEIDADSFRSYAQRYPYAGAQNAGTRLLVIDLDTMQSKSIKYHTVDDPMQLPYLARVQFTPDSKHLFLQVQSRDQKNLKIINHSLETNIAWVVLSENHPTWINLHNNLYFIKTQVQSTNLQFLWTSERSDLSQVYHYTQTQERDGQDTYICIQITDGQCRVNRIAGVQLNKVYFEGWQASPTEQHLFSVGLEANSQARQITKQAAWHECKLNNNCTQYIDRRSSIEQPASLHLESEDGSQGDTIAHNLLDNSSAYFPWVNRHSYPQLGELTASDGQTLQFRLTKPTILMRGEHYPVIVYVYGGPGVQRVKNEWCSLILQLFARAGFGVLELDNRGSANRTKSFEDPIYGELGTIEVEDQLLGTKYLASLDWVDSARIGVFGHSYGGYMALKCLSQAPNIFRAGVAVAPVTDWHLYDTHYTERFLGLPETNAKGYTASNIIPLNEKLQSKLLIMHGMSDDNVLFTHSTKLFKALQDNNTEFEMMTYPGAKHAMQQQSVMVHRYHTIINFFRRTLT